MKKLFLGIIISAVFLFYVIKGLDYKEVLKNLTDINYLFLIPSLIMFVSLAFLRSFRWGVILSPMEEIRQNTLFPINCIGYMAIALFPLRLGEFIRPYIISTKSRISLSSGIATIFVERIFDSLSILFIMLFIILKSDLPDWLKNAGYSLFLTFLIAAGIILLLYFKTEFSIKILCPLINKLPQNIKSRIESLIKTFVDGFKIISYPKRLLYTICLSILIWVFSALSIYSLYFLQNIQLPLISAFMVLVFNAIGVSIPAAPGFLGNFQFACILALSIFGVPKSEALAFSIVFYLLGIGINILLGLVFIPFVEISFQDMKEKFGA